MSWVQATRKFGGPVPLEPSIAITRTGRGKISLVISLGAKAPAGFARGTRVWLQIGEGENAGLLRVETSATGNKLQRRGAATHQLEFRTAVPDQLGTRRPCAPQKLDVVEIGDDYAIYRAPDLRLAPPAKHKRVSFNRAPTPMSAGSNAHARAMKAVGLRDGR